MKTFKSFREFSEFNEGIMDLLTKKGREKRGKERVEKKAKIAQTDKEKKDYDQWKYYADKASRPTGTADDDKKAKELEKLPHVKAKIKAIRDKYNKGGSR